MAWPSLKRGILKARVARVRKAFGGLLGGILGFAAEGCSVPHILRVSLPVTTYHLPSGDLRTRTSKAVAKLIALQPRTARVVRNGQEVGDRIEERPSGTGCGASPMRYRPVALLGGAPPPAGIDRAVDELLTHSGAPDTDRRDGASLLLDVAGRGSRAPDQ